MTRRIFLVGDDPDTTHLLKDCLELLGCRVETERCGTRAIEKLRHQEYSGIILDIVYPGIRGIEILRQLRQGGSMLPVIALSGNAVQNDVNDEGVYAFLAKPFTLREFKRVVQRSIPAAREELIQDHSSGESMIQQHASALARAGDFARARKAIELLDDTDSRRSEYIRLLAYQIRAGDLVGAKETVFGAPSLRIGGDWVRCMMNSLVKAGDVCGAWAIAENLLGVDEQAFHKAMIVAQQAAAGDLSGAKATLLRFSPRERGRDCAIGAIANALVTAGDFEDALNLVCHMTQVDALMDAIGEILHAQSQRSSISAAVRTAAILNNQELSRHAFEMIAQIKEHRYQHTHTLMMCGKSGVTDTFASLYPIEYDRHKGLGNP